MQSMLHEDAVLKPTARTLWEVQEKVFCIPAETATNLYTDVCRRAEQALHESAARRQSIRDADDLRTYQKQIKEEFAETIGGIPTVSSPLSSLQTGQLHQAGFTVDKILLSPRSGSFASANVYVPVGRSAPGPAVLLVVGHTDAGKADPEYQYVAQLLCHAGFVTMVLDPLGEGERFEHYESTLDFQPIQGCSGEHDLLDWKCKLLGQSLARYFIQDGLTALTYLASRSDVNPHLIGLTGHSGGGTQTCMLMLAASEQLACAAPCAYITDTRAMLEVGVDPDNEMLWPGSLARNLDYLDLLACMAPKPLLFLTTLHDFFPREGTLRTYEEACKLWRASGGASVPEIATAGSQHAYAPSLAQAAAKFFSRVLAGQEADLSSFAFVPLPAAALQCTPAGSLLKEIPAMRTLQDELTARLEDCQRSRPSWPQVYAWLRDTLHLDFIETASVPRVYDEGICGHLLYRCMIWRPESGYWSNGVLLRDMRQGSRPLPTVIALWPEGLARLTEHSCWLHRSIANGWQVLVLDLAGSGTLLPAPLARSSMHIGWGTFYKLNAYLLQLGDSLCGLRIRQLVAAIAMIRRWPEVSSTMLYAQGEEARIASLGALLSRTPAYLDNTYQPYGEIIAQRYHDQTHTPFWIIPDILRYIDTQDILHQLQQLDLLTSDPSCCRASAQIYTKEYANGGIQP